MKYWYFILLVFFACSTEQRDDCFTSLGDVGQEVRQLTTFSRIYVEDRIQLLLVQDSLKQGKVVLDGPENLLAQIKSEIRNGQLILTNTNTCNFVRSFNYNITVTAYFSDLTEIRVESIATVSTPDTLFLEGLNIYHNALSDITLLLNCQDEIYVRSINSARTELIGKAKVLKGSIEEVSDLDARNLDCEEVLLDSHTPIDCFVKGQIGLYVNLSNSGNIYYLGEPSVYKVVNIRRSTGDLLPFY